MNYLTTGRFAGTNGELLLYKQFFFAFQTDDRADPPNRIADSGCPVV
jgi:hypothetical protein